MARAEIHPGVCGLNTTVVTRMNSHKCTVSIESECKAIQELATELQEVDPYQEISFRKLGPQTLKLGAAHCYHTACPVPVGIIKAIEVAAQLALPADVTIKLSKDDE